MTIKRLEAALDVVAECMVMHDRPQFAPYVERLEREIAALRSKDDVMERARRRLYDRGRHLSANKVAKQNLVSQ